MEDKQTNKPSPIAQVAIHRISEVDWFMVDYTSEVGTGKNIGSQISIGVKLQNRVEPANKLTFIRSNVFYQLITASGEQRPMLSYTVDVAYEIDNFFEIFKEQADDKYEVPDHFLQTLCSIALSTVRGLLVAKTANTYLRDVYLPVLSPDELKKIVEP